MLGKLEGTVIVLDDGFFYILEPGEYQTISSWLRDDDYDDFADKIYNKGNSIKFLAVKYSDQIKKGKNYMNFLEKFDEQLEKNSGLTVWDGPVKWEKINNIYNTSGLHNSLPSRDILFIEFGAGDDDHNGLSVRSFTSARKLKWFKMPTITTTDYEVREIVT